MRRWKRSEHLDINQLKERPILFSAPMVRAILDGRKSQTRRAMKHQPGQVTGSGRPVFYEHGTHGRRVSPSCPYGKAGDRLWVRETWLNHALPGYPPVCFYRADDENKPADRSWKPSIHMPRQASRIALDITNVRMERLQAITRMDAEAEGFQKIPGLPIDPRDWFRSLWQTINGPGSWQQNPWVWVVEFNVLSTSDQATL